MVDLPPVRVSFDWHEGSGSATTTIAGDGTNPFNAGNPATAWSGQSAQGFFHGFVLWKPPSAEIFTEWSVVFDITMPSLPGGESSMARVKNAYLNVYPDGKISVYPDEQVSAPGVLAAGVTYRIGLVNTNTGRRLYVNGDLIITGTTHVTVNSGDDSAEVLLGGLAGIVDNFDLYPVALTDEQAVFATSGEASPDLSCSGTVAVVSSTSGAITSKLPASGTVAATSDTAGGVTSKLPASGTVTVLSATSGAVAALLAVSGTVAVVAVTTGAVAARLGASAIIAVVSATSGAVGVIRAGGAPSNTGVWNGSTFVPSAWREWTGDEWRDRSATY